MKVNPNPLGKAQNPLPNVTSKPGEVNRAPADARRAIEPRDQVELSESGRALTEMGVTRDKESSLEPARLREVLGRIQQGFYDRQEVQDEVVRRLAADLELS